MKKRLSKIFRSFKAKILLSFFAFIRIFILWICIYFIINRQQTNLNLFTNHITNLQNHYSESNRYFQNFILTGYHQPSFYITGKQKDLDLFDSEQHVILKNLEEIKIEAQSNHIKINDQLQDLSRLHKNLLDTVELLKQLYLLKGFKHFGAEGAMLSSAHFLEDSCPILKMDILMLRRREKDFMLRDEPKYIEDFNYIIDKQILKFSSSPLTLNALLNYKKSFNEFANYTDSLSINTDHGVYGHTKYIIKQLDEKYIFTSAKVVKEISNLNNLFKTVLIGTFILLLLAAIYLSIVLSNDLTKDIKKLNKTLGDFIRSGFKDIEGSQPETLSSKITEVQGLNDDFNYLRQTLKQTLSDLENSIQEEKQVSAAHELTIIKLREQIKEMEKQK